MSVWQDVRFDRTAALEAAEVVRELAAVLDAATEERELVGRAARQDWEGTARSQADTVLAREHRQAADVVDGLRLAAERIHLGAEEAASEQDRRQRRREELHEQRRDQLRMPPAGRPAPELVR